MSDTVVKTLNQKFRTKRLGELTWFMGSGYIRDRKFQVKEQRVVGVLTSALGFASFSEHRGPPLGAKKYEKKKEW